MGLFCLQKENTVEELIKAARKNIELYLKENDEQFKYLLDTFAINQLKDAEDLLTRETTS